MVRLYFQRRAAANMLNRLNLSPEGFLWPFEGAMVIAPRSTLKTIS